MKWDGNQYRIHVQTTFSFRIVLMGVNHNHKHGIAWMVNKCVFNEAINSCLRQDFFLNSFIFYLMVKKLDKTVLTGMKRYPSQRGDGYRFSRHCI